MRRLIASGLSSAASFISWSPCELRFRRFVWFIARAAQASLEEARQIALLAVAGTLDLSVDAFLPSPRRLAQILGREPPAVLA